jgi:outer membrane beta-barrel protein
MKTGQGSSSEMYGMSKDPLLFATIAAFLCVGTAHAQDTGTAAAPAPEGAPAADAASADPAGQMTEASATAAEKDLEADLSLFWGKRREVSVVQKRLVEKDGRFEATAFFGTIPNDDFIVYFPVGLRLGYHISEQFAVEYSGAYAIQKPSGLTGYLEDELGLKTAQIQQKMNHYHTVDFLWAPFYGKISLLGTKLTHFETYVGLGGGFVFTETKTETNPQPQSKQGPAGNALLGFRWFINDYVNIRTDYRHFFFEKFRGGVSIPAEFSLGVGVMFP